MHRPLNNLMDERFQLCEMQVAVVVAWHVYIRLFIFACFGIFIAQYCIISVDILMFSCFVFSRFFVFWWITGLLDLLDYLKGKGRRLYMYREFYCLFCR